MGFFSHSDKGKSSDAAAPMDGPPPSYDSHADDHLQPPTDTKNPNIYDQSSDEEGGGDPDEPPEYPASLDDRAHSPVPSSMAKFPAAWNVYVSWKFKKPCHIGTSADEKLFAVRNPWGLLNRKPTLVLHDGTSTDDPVLAETWTNGWTKNWVKLYNHPGCGPGGEPVVVDCDCTGRIKRTARHFEMDTGPVLSGAGTGGSSSEEKQKGTLERHTFEWRDTHGAEIKQLAGRSFGWKLVWLTGPNVQAEESGGGSGSSSSRSRSGRSHGCSSDGKEVVAVLALNSSWSRKKWLRFEFLGTGRTGQFGEAWETMVTASSLRLWQIYQQTVAASSSAAAAGASA